MKKIYWLPMLVLSVLIFGFRAESLTTKGVLEGFVTSPDGEALIGASIVVKGESIRTTTDIEGSYSLKLEEGVYEIVISYTGYTSKEEEVRIKAGEKTELNIQLKEGILVDEVVVTGYATASRSERKGSKRIRRRKSSEAIALDAVSSAPTKSVSVIAGKVADVSISSEVKTVGDFDFEMSKKLNVAGSIGEKLELSTIYEPTAEFEFSESKKIKIKDSYFEAKGFLLDGKVVSENLIPMAELTPLEVIVLKNKKVQIEEIVEKEKLPKAGQLTAGEWNDLEHFKKWKKQLKEKDFQLAKADWNIDATNRYSVLVENDEGQPLADVEVHLLNSNDEIVWKARTDNFGKAELWVNIFDENVASDKFKINVKYNGETHTIKKAKAFKRVNKIEIETDCNISNQVDIMFAVDATGSMTDEINYLKSEMQDVIRRLQKGDRELEIRLGAVFYRDHGDAYLTQSTPLDDNIQTTVEFIKKQNAGGGGDYPEAVDAALEEAIEKQNWSEDAVARIVFLVLDAPPHMAQTNIKSLQKSIRIAAEKGIKIIPITASGINRTTEYLMKNMSLATNGTYVFITDDSGIGNSHLEPSNKDFKVEFLNDLMVRLLEKYTDRKACEEEEDQVRFAQNDDPDVPSSTLVFKNDPSILNKVKYFPNPATTSITIRLQERISLIEILSANGQVVKRLENVDAGDHPMDLSGLSEGFYLIRFKKDRSVASGKLIVIKP